MTDYNQEFNVDAYDNIDKLKEHIKPYLEAYFMMRDEYEKLKDENKKLRQKATAWDIVNNGADWENLRDLCDTEMCKALIETGECDTDDFEGYEGYQEIFYFSYDEQGYTFFEDTKSLIDNTPRIEDCYVYVGNTTKDRIKDEDDDYREVNVEEYLATQK